MSELANYSIETDQLVWLSFKNGKSLRVPVEQLARYLTPHDLVKVRRAIHMRRDFFRNNMPKALVVLVALGMVALMVSGGTVLAHVWRPNRTALPAAPSTEIVRNVEVPTANPAPIPSPGSNAVARTPRKAATVPTSHRVAVRRSMPTSHDEHVADAHGLADTTQPNPDAAAIPPASDSAPVPTPAPIEPPAGQVLGDSTGPSPSPTPDPAPVTP